LLGGSRHLSAWRAKGVAYRLGMDEQAPSLAPPEWPQALDRAKEDVAAGRMHLGTEVRQRLRNSVYVLLTLTSGA
jgi:hypothetical protein